MKATTPAPGRPDGGAADPFTSRQAAAALWLGSVGLLILGLQPVLLGAMLSEDKVDFDGLALIATSEIIAIALGSTLERLVAAPTSARGRAAGLLLALAGLDVASGLVSGLGAWMAVRSLAGLVEGALVAFAIALVARTPHPQRSGGWFVIVQTLLQAAVVLVLSQLVLARWGSEGGFVVMALVSAASLPAAVASPAGYAPIVEAEDGGEGGMGPRPVLALASIFVFFLFVGSIWAFLEPIGARSGLTAAAVGTIVAATLVAQITGASLSTWAAWRLRPVPGILACATLAAAAVGAILTTPSAALFWVAALTIGFVWLFVIPCQVGLAVAVDPSRRAVRLVPAANLLGAAIGPVLGSLFVDGDEVIGLVWFALGAIALSLALLLPLVGPGHGGGRAERGPATAEPT